MRPVVDDAFYPFFKRNQMRLSEIIIKKIKSEGPLSFHDFMEMALYHPKLGYYTSGTVKFGKNGDYYTSPVLSSIYGQMIGVQLEEMWEIMDKNPMIIVEYGAGSGALCLDILSYLKKNQPLYDDLKYYIIEKSPSLRQRQQKWLKEKIEWIDNINEIKDFCGCVLSNEVVDNFSVHLAVMEDELLEVFVDYTDKFIEILRPASEKIKECLIQQKICLPKGYRTEINLQAREWLREIATNLQRGFVITIDYGFLSNELYCSERKNGTLACYHQHAVNLDPYCNIGQQDITAHVNFSNLQFWGRNYGLECTGFCNQHDFLHSLGLAGYLRTLEKKSGYKDNTTFYQVYKLLMEMGNKFKVLIQQKGIKSKSIKGMQLATHYFV